MTNQNNRINWIDWAKFIGIFLIVLGHLYRSNYPLNVLIYTFLVPLFFALSGLTFKPRPIIDEVKLSARRLLVPYCIFMVLGYIFRFVVGALLHPENNEYCSAEVAIKSFLGLLYGVGFEMPFSNVVNIPLWFLIALFCMRIMVSAIQAFLQKDKNKHVVTYAIICIIAPTLAYVLKQYDVVPPFSLRSVFMTLPFFVVAYLLKDCIKQVTLIKCWKRLITCVLLFTSLTFLSGMNGRVGACASNFGHYPLLFFANGFMGIVALILGCSLLNAYMPRIISFTSRNTITILGTHGFVIPFVTVFVVRFVLGNTSVISEAERLEFLHEVCSYDIWLIVTAAICLILCMIPCYIFERWFPRLVGK